MISGSYVRVRGCQREAGPSKAQRGTERGERAHARTRGHSREGAGKKGSAKMGVEGSDAGEVGPRFEALAAGSPIHYKQRRAVVTGITIPRHLGSLSLVPFRLSLSP